DLQPVISGIVAAEPIQQLLLQGLQNPMTMVASFNGALHLYTDTEPLEYRDGSEQLNLSNLQVDLSIAADRSTDLVLAVTDATMRSPFYQVTTRGSWLHLQNPDFS